MRLWRGKSRLPLLVKELTEQAARRRTYVIRVIYAAALFSCFSLMLWSNFETVELSPQGVLGRGRDVFRTILVLEFGAIFVFLPAMMSGVLTYEKERDSLSLLFLTDLRPWEILLQKYLGRLIPIFMYLLLSLPLMLLAYSIGGIAVDDIIRSGWMLLLTCLQVGAFALMCSAYCRTSLSAILCSYLGCGLFYGLSLIVVLALSAWLDIDPRNHTELVLFLVPPVFFEESRLLLDPASRLYDFFAACWPMVVSTALFLLLARCFLIRRAFVQSRSGMLHFFRKLDRFYEWLNPVTGGVVLTKDRNTLPADKPVLWRETARKSLGKPRYLLRTLLLLEAPAIFIVLITAWDDPFLPPSSESGSWVILILWVIAALWITASAANVVAAERTDQTLEVLLTTPLSGREIVYEKMGAIRRLIVVMGIALLTIVFLRIFIELQRTRSLLPEGYLLYSLLGILIYPQMLAWVAFWIGMKCASRMKATLFSLVSLLLWCVLPPVVVSLIVANPGGLSDDYAHLDLKCLNYLSPATALISTEADHFPGMARSHVLTVILLNYLWYGGILLYFRHLCLKNADVLLGRMSRGGPKLQRSGTGWKSRLGLDREIAPDEA